MTLILLKSRARGAAPCRDYEWISGEKTADGAKYQDVAYLDRRIKACKSEIKARKKNIVHYEETLSAIERGEKKKRYDGTPVTVEVVTGWMEHEYELIEKAIDKQAFLEACVDQCGGIPFSRDNVKVGYHVKVKGDRYAVSGAAANRAADDVNMPGLSGKSVVSVVVTQNERSENH